jgi:hypothetical protein
VSKTVVIHQPDFLPHPAFFHRLLSADLYVVLDHVQFVNGTSRSWTHRDKIKTPLGAQWLTVGVRKAPRATPINALQLADDTGWKSRSLNLVRENYRDAPHFDQIFDEINALYALPCATLVEFTMASIEMLLRLFNIVVPSVRSSTLTPTGHKNDLLVDLLRKVDATHYLSGLGARSYFLPGPFADAGIDVSWQRFTSPVYPQLHGAFVSDLSSIDMLFNCGIDRSRELVRNC